MSKPNPPITDVHSDSELDDEKIELDNIIEEEPEDQLTAHANKKDNKTGKAKQSRQQSSKMTEGELDNHNHGGTSGSFLLGTTSGGVAGWGTGASNLAVTSTTNNRGSNTPLNVVQPTVFTLWIIKC